MPFSVAGGHGGRGLCFRRVLRDRWIDRLRKGILDLGPACSQNGRGRGRRAGDKDDEYRDACVSVKENRVFAVK